MPFSHAARKYSRAKWEKPSYVKNDDIPADAVTICLKTTNNKLSLWECVTENNSIEEVVLALTTGTKVTHIEKMHIIALPQDAIKNAQLVLDKSEGDTLVDELRDRHVDLIELTLSKLTTIANMMASQIQREIHCHSFTRKQVAKILNSSVEAGKISVEKLNSKIQEQLKSLE